MSKSPTNTCVDILTCTSKLLLYPLIQINTSLLFHLSALDVHRAVAPEVIQLILFPQILPKAVKKDNNHRWKRVYDPPL